MSNSWSTDADSVPELPGPPLSNGVNISFMGEVSETYFESVYSQYRDTPYFEDAKKVFLSPSLNGKARRGVNTWHEQVLAGRLSLEDLKVLGYANLAQQRVHTTVLLIALLREKNPLTPAQMRTAFNTVKTSLVFGTNPPVKARPQEAIINLINLVSLFPEQEIGVLYFHDAVTHLSLPTAQRLVARKDDKAWTFIRFTDDFLAAVTDDIAPDETKHLKDLYSGRELLLMMTNGFTAKETVSALSRGLSPERALESKGMPNSIIEGVL